MNSTCLIDSADRRLFDGLNLWIEAKSKYFSPDGFRLSLNNVIQALRNVTFVLQKSKNTLPGFDDWYSPWQEKMRNDPLMRWLIDSRNIIVKQGDLEMHSRARISIVESWFELPKLEVDISPSINTSDFDVLIRTIVPANIPLDVGLIKVERRWVDSRMPTEEILGILAHAFDILSQLLYDAHVCLLGESDEVKRCQLMTIFSSSRGRIPPCMLGLEWDRTIWFNAKDGSLIIPESTSIKVSKSGLEEARKRYKGSDDLKKDIAEASDLESKARAFFQQAKTVLQTDGYHIPIALLGFPDGRQSAVNLQMNARSDKHIVIRQLASDVEKFGITSVILINEAWLSENLTRYAVDDPNRKECLQLIAVDSDGQEFAHTALFSHNKDGQIIFTGEIIDTGVINLLQPIRDAWKLQKRTFGKRASS